jgi:hypothetical protein
MAGDLHRPDEFIAYPTNRVVGTIADPQHARDAIEALLQGGFAQQDIDVLHCEDDLHRPDRTGTERRFLAQFQRTLVRKLGEYRHLRLGEEFDHLRHCIEDVRAGRCVIMVLAKKREKREAAADILGSHGAEVIEFYGRWSYQSLEPHSPSPLDTPLRAAAPGPREDGTPGPVRDPSPGRTYEIDLGGTATHVRLDSESRVTILRRSAPALSHLPVTQLRPNLLMVGWQEPDRTTTVHVYDFESGEAHAIVGYGERRVRRARGTVRRVDEVAPANRPL